MTCSGDDYVAIHDLYVRLSHHVDGGLDGAGGLFMADGVVAAGETRLVGPDAISGYAAGASAGAVTRHLVLNLAVEGEGDRRETRATALVAVSRQGAQDLVVVDYRGVVVRAEGIWRFQEHAISPVFRVKGQPA